MCICAYAHMGREWRKENSLSTIYNNNTFLWESGKMVSLVVFTGLWCGPEGSVL